MPPGDPAKFEFVLEQTSGKETRLRAADAAGLERWVAGLPPVAPAPGGALGRSSPRSSSRGSGFKASPRT